MSDSEEHNDGDPAEVEMTAEEWVDELAASMTQAADTVAQFGAHMTSTWWNALPVARPGGFDMAGSAAMLAARLAKLGPESDPLEIVTIASVAWAQNAEAQVRAQVEELEELRQAVRGEQETADRQAQKQSET